MIHAVLTALALALPVLATSASAAQWADDRAEVVQRLGDKVKRAGAK